MIIIMVMMMITIILSIIIIIFNEIDNTGNFLELIQIIH